MATKARTDYTAAVQLSLFDDIVSKPVAPITTQPASPPPQVSKLTAKKGCTCTKRNGEACASCEQGRHCATCEWGT